MVQTLSVRPRNGAWSLTGDFFDNEMLFASGGKAEAAAQSLGRRVAGSGRTAQIEIWVRDGTLAGRFVCPPFAANE